MKVIQTKKWICLIQAWQVTREHAFPTHPLWGEFLLMFRPQSWPRWSAAPDGFVWKSCAPKSTGLSLVYLVNYTIFAILIAVTGGCTAFSGTTRKQPPMFSMRSISCLWRSSKNHSANCHWPWQLEISLGREGLGGKGIVLYWSSDGEMGIIMVLM